MTTARNTLPVGMTPRLLTARQAAAYCGVAEECFEQNCGLPPIRVFGNRKLWDRKALDRWLDGVSGIDSVSTSARGSIEERLNGDPSAGD